MNDDQKKSPDRKTRVDGDRVIHTPQGTPYHGNRYETPRGLTNEQAEEQRVGAKLDERQTREAVQEHLRPAIEHPRGGTDEVAEEPYGRKGGKQPK